MSATRHRRLVPSSAIALLGALAVFLALAGSARAADPPIVLGVAPTTGSTAGGTVVVIIGDHFTGATAVDFGGVTARPSVLTDSFLTVVSPPHAAGLVHLRVIGPGGTSAPTAADNFTYVGGPIVSSLSPAAGPVAGGTVVTVTGSGFTGASSVNFGGVTVTPSSVTATTLVVTSPPHPAGVVHVRVTTADGTSPETPGDDFTYIGLPVVTSVSPRSGSVSGGTAVTITGQNFNGALSVQFGAATVVPASVTPTIITVVSPPNAAGTVHLRVTTPYGTSAPTSADDFTYVTTPVVTGISPTSGSTAGGTLVTISGAGFAGATSVDFGGTLVAPTVNSDSLISVTSPPHAAGVVHLRVTTPLGTSVPTTADNFTYVGTAAVSGISPTSGSTAGGTVVTIRGVGFTGATAVSFGDTSVAPSSVSDTQIVVISPPGSPGTVHLRVTTPSGVSPETANDNFIYVDVPTILSISPRSGPQSGGNTVVISGTSFTGATGVSFGNITVAPASVTDTRITVIAPARPAGVVHLHVITPFGTSPSTGADDYTYLATSSTTYTLSFRWTLIVWAGPTGFSVVDALRGREVPDDPNTNDVYNQVTAIYRWDPPNQHWDGYFPGNEDIPGVNDFTTFRNGEAYWVAVRGPGAVIWRAVGSVAQPIGIELTEADNGRHITLHTGDALAIILSSNPSTGYRWEIAGSIPAQLRQDGQVEYIPPAVTPPIVGAAGRERFAFFAAAAGTGRLTLIYRRPFDPVGLIAATFTIDITVVR